MKQVYRVLCTYSADLFGICSALYELGGLVVMHDASGCNSTYNTHDEPRWYDMDSMVYVSGLNEDDAILGNDQKLIDDVCEIAFEQKPEFIALSCSVLPMFMGIDMNGIAKAVQKKTGIVTFGFMTTGIKSYVTGAGDAFYKIARQFCNTVIPIEEKSSHKIKLNLLGVTPLDFSIGKNSSALTQFFEESGFDIISTWAMGNTLEQLKLAPIADVNVVVSSTGMKVARFFEKKYGIPYVIGIPIGEKVGVSIHALITKAYKTKKSQRLTISDNNHSMVSMKKQKICVIGESVYAVSMKYCLKYGFGFENVQILCPIEDPAHLLENDDSFLIEEEDIEILLNKTDIVIGDPIYRRIIHPDNNVSFIDMPHTAYSGRLYEKEMPLFIGISADIWLKNWLEN